MIRGYALAIIWRRILDEYIAKFGFSDNFLAIARKQKHLIRLKVQRAVNDDRSTNLFIKIAEDELKSLQSSHDATYFYELKGALDIAGFNINPMETSVAEFYMHLKTLSKQSFFNVLFLKHNIWIIMKTYKKL